MASRPSTAALLAALLLPGVAAAGNLFCCQDPASGRRVCSDYLPDQCRGRPYRILDSAGNVIKEVEGALTSEQKAQRAAEAKRQKEEEALQREQRRKDQALLETYSSPQEIDKAQAHVEKELLQAIAQAEAKIADTRKQRKRWEDEAEFYSRKTLPPDVERGLKNADYEIKAQTTLLESKKKDLEAVRARFAEDRSRYLQLMRGSRNGGAAAANGGGSDPRPR